MEIMPYAFKIRLPKEIKLSEGNEVRFQASESDAALVASYLGSSRIDRMSMFKTMKLENGAVDLADVFDGSTTIDGGGTWIHIISEYPALISTLEDPVQGFTVNETNN